MQFTEEVEIVEVGPRDGLQNEKKLVATEDKKALIWQLHHAGFRRIETVSFVHPKVVPQMADAKDIAKFCNELGITYIALTPNIKALQLAIEANVPQIAVFVGASEMFNQQNIRRSIDESLEECAKMFQMAKAHGQFIRAYVSMAFSCPFEGSTRYEALQRIVEHFVWHGADEISIGDTNGQANPRAVYERMLQLQVDFSEAVFVGHFHDTNGFAYANILAALQAGVTKFDSSIGGLGGCPFSPGATGNVATEKVVEMMDLMCIETNVKRDRLAKCVSFARQLV